MKREKFMESKSYTKSAAEMATTTKHETKQTKCPPWLVKQQNMFIGEIRKRFRMLAGEAYSIDFWSPSYFQSTICRVTPRDGFHRFTSWFSMYFLLCLDRFAESQLLHSQYMIRWLRPSTGFCKYVTGLAPDIFSASVRYAITGSRWHDYCSTFASQTTLQQCSFQVSITGDWPTSFIAIGGESFFAVHPIYNSINDFSVSACQPPFISTVWTMGEELGLLRLLSWTKTLAWLPLGMVSSTDVWRNLATAIKNFRMICLKQEEISLLPTQHKNRTDVNYNIMCPFE